MSGLQHLTRRGAVTGSRVKMQHVCSVLWPLGYPSAPCRQPTTQPLQCYIHAQTQLSASCCHSALTNPRGPPSQEHSQALREHDALLAWAEQPPTGGSCPTLWLTQLHPRQSHRAAHSTSGDRITAAPARQETPLPWSSKPGTSHISSCEAICCCAACSWSLGSSARKAFSRACADLRALPLKATNSAFSLPEICARAGTGKGGRVAAGALFNTIKLLPGDAVCPCSVKRCQNSGNTQPPPYTQTLRVGIES